MAEEALGGTAGPFYPSAAHNRSRGLLAGRLLADAEGCGRAGCHPAAAAEWRSSPHRYAGLENPWYRTSFEAFRAAMGPVPSRWCAGCHSPALLQSGEIDRLPAAGAAPAGPAPEAAVAAAGVACAACHAIGAARSSMGQGDYELDLPPLHDLAASAEPFLQEIHEHLVRIDPESHRRAYARPALGSAELCSTCHKSHLDVPVNGKGWLREMDDYTPWQANAVSGQGARSFNAPAAVRSCVDCHMRGAGEAPPVTGRPSHRFAAANTALPALHGDRAQLAAVERFLAARQVTVDLFALSGPQAAAPEPVSAAGAPPELVAPLGRVAAAVRRGETRRVTVVVRTRGVGHQFPGGKQDAPDCWLELKAVDDRGRVVFWSGRADERSPVDPGAHFFRTRWVDERGEPINRRDVWRARGQVYQRVIGPDSAAAVHYRLEVPPDAGDRITLTTRLNYRKLAWDFTQWVFTGGASPAPRPPIVVLAEDTATLAVVDAGAPLPAVGESPPGSGAPRGAAAAEDAERWHDYGVALTLQGDLRGARAALETVTRLAPGHLDAWINLSRVALADGDLAFAKTAAEQAARLAPGSPRVDFYLGQLAARNGDGKQARERLRRAVAGFPRDRGVRRELVNQLLLDQDYEGAAKELESILDVDPEDRAAHLSLTLAYRALGQPERAERHQKLAARFAPLEAGEILSQQFWAAHPDDNLERQQVHEHRSLPLAGLPQERSGKKGSGKKGSGGRP